MESKLNTENRTELQRRHIMRQKIPGFYYDEEEFRYFPINGCLAGYTSSPESELKPDSERNPKLKLIQESNYQRKTNLKALNLLYCRELNGNVIPINKTKSNNFNDEIQKIQVCNPEVWRYGLMENVGDCVLKHVYVDIQTSKGLIRKNVLMAGSTYGGVNILAVTKAGQVFDESETRVLLPSHRGPKCIPVSVLSGKENDSEEREAPWHIWKPSLYNLSEASSVTSINLLGRDDGSENPDAVSRALITILGSSAGDGSSIFIMDLDEGLNMLASMTIETTQELDGGISKGCSIWTADCNLSRSHAAIGTDVGATLVDLETGTGSHFLQSKSHVLALQYDDLGNVVQCGLRNGAIVLVDLRERPGSSFTRLAKHQLKGNINPSNIIYMPSSIACLKRLKTYDQYFVASSFDGTMKLYDQRMVKKGAAVQTYEGHVNSQTRIEFGIDPSERFLMSGGEDCYTRIWSIKSGQLLSENQFSNYVPTAMCWPTFERQSGSRDDILHGAWLGTHDAIYNVL